MRMISGETLVETWLKACMYLHDERSPSWTDTTVVLNIERPTSVTAPDRQVSDRLDEFLLAHDRYKSHTVAETIFPGYEYKRRGVEGVYDVYPNEVFPRLMKLPEVRRWGTYANRLLRRVAPDGQQYNPLKDCIAKMNQRQPVRACYEVGFGFGFDIATYDDDVDRKDRMARPCLSHLSFKLIGRSVHLTALYRSHFYIHRAYGNLLGLARLQRFVADQVGVETGPLVCHSTMARLEYGKKQWGFSKSEVRQLITELRDLWDDG